MLNVIRKRMKGQKGFTLIELLVVIIIIAILAAIAIPTFLGQREKAQDAAAKSLIRNAMTAMESTYVDLRSFANVAVADLAGVEPAIGWGDPALANAHTAAAARTAANAVDWNGPADSQYELGTLSESGKIFGVTVDKAVAPGARYWVTDRDGVTTEVGPGWVGDPVMAAPEAPAEPLP